MKPILIHCHIFYPELWDELKQCILNISPYPFELYVTMVEEHFLLTENIRKTFPKAHIEIVENRGYDIGPFIHILNKVDLNKYSYIIKLHTKRDMPVGAMLGVMNVSGKKWREYALSFLKTPDIFTKVIGTFEQNKKLGMHGNYHLIMDKETQDPESAQKAHKLLQKLGFKNDMETFVAGTMFMARSDLFKPVQKLRLKINDFEVPDKQHKKTTFAHVMERFFGYIITAQSCQIQDVETRHQYRGGIWNYLRKWGLFFYRCKPDKKGDIKVRICRIPVLSFSVKENGRIRVHLLGIKIFSRKKKNPLMKQPRPHMRPIIIAKNSSPKGVIYTCITGGYDALIQHNCVNHNFDYVCFTDNEKLLKQKQVGIWQIRPLVFDKSDDTRNNRWHKTHPHILFPEYDLSIYLDSNIDVLSPKLFDTINPTQKLLVPIHYARDCIYNECLEVISTQKDTAEHVQKMESFLKEHHMPRHYGLTENCIIIRHHNDPQIKKVMEGWWDLIAKYTKRDQLSFSYVLWKNGIKISDICFDNARFDYKNYYFESHIQEVKK